MKKEAYIFSGFGHAAGAYKIRNADIFEAIQKEYLKGFREDRIRESKNFKTFSEKHPDVHPFDYFAGHKMGFFERHHVTPFPPTIKKLFYAETSLDLGVKAIENALQDAGLNADAIDAWMVSTVSPHEQAPGIAATIKAHFTDFENQAPTMSLASGCSGFNLNLEKAIDFFKSHPAAQHIVVAHTETMSHFLTQRIKFVPFVTFGDAAAAIILSRTTCEEACGVLDISNYQDLHMVDFVGVDKEANLYMDDSIIKDRAIVNIARSGKEILERSGWQAEDCDLFVPHQTGNAILYPAAKDIGLRPERLYTESQNRYGNVSGATVPISLSLLAQQGKLQEGMKIMSAVAGVGGKYGAFTYRVPKAPVLKSTHTDVFPDLRGKTCVITGASGQLGKEMAKLLGKKQAHVVLHYNRNESSVKKVAESIRENGGNADIIQADFTDPDNVNRFCEQVSNTVQHIHYLVHAAGLCEEYGQTDAALKEAIFQINFYAPQQISKILLPRLRETVMYIGTSAEDYTMEGFPAFISSKKSQHGAAGSASGELRSKGIRTIYYMPAILDKGTSEQVPGKMRFLFMMKNGQEHPVPVKECAERMLRSLYIPKVQSVTNSYEGPMIVRRDGYVLETDI